MTPTLRYLLAVGLPIVAALIGFVFTTPPASDEFDQRLAAWPEISGPADYSNSVDRFVSDLSAMYLFGQVAEQTSAAAVAADAEEPVDPGLDGYNLVANPELNGTQAATLDDPNGMFITVREGDTVANGWTVTTIDRGMIVFEKDGEFRTLSRASALGSN